MSGSPGDCLKLGFMLKGVQHVCPAFSQLVSATPDESQGLDAVHAVILLELHFWHGTMGHSKVPHYVLLLTADIIFCSPIRVHNQKCFKIYPKMETGTEGQRTWQALSSSEKPEPTKYCVAYQQLNQNCS